MGLAGRIHKRSRQKSHFFTGGRRSRIPRGQCRADGTGAAGKNQLFAGVREPGLRAASAAANKLSAPHDPRLVARPIAILIHSPLVVLLFTLGKTNGQFGASVLPIQLQRNERVALALHGTDQT
jgi:hypothetical protein